MRSKSCTINVFALLTNAKGMRETLYFKDDDARLHFYIIIFTPANLNDHDIERIIKMHLNINVSVHTQS